MSRLPRRHWGFLIVLLLLLGGCSNDPSSTAGEAGSEVGREAEVAAGADAGGPAEPEQPEPCRPDELCVTVMATETSGADLRLMLYEADANDWPHRYRTLPTPSWVVSEYPPVPDTFPLHLRIPIAENLFAISSEPLEGSRLGLAIATGAASIMTVESTDARGFSGATLVYEPGTAMDFGTVDLALPAGDTCELNPYNPVCLTGSAFWQEHHLGEVGFVPGAIYLDLADVDGDGISDIVTVGEPHFENPDLPLEELKLAVYYLNRDLTVRESEIVDQWSEDDQTFYSAWGVKLVEHSGEPLIIVGTNIPDLAPLEDGSGAVLAYRRQPDGTWVRSEVVTNPEPRSTNYNAMIVVACDLDGDGDDDLALSSAFGSSATGSWMENTGRQDPMWLPHHQPMAAGIDPAVRGVLAYKCADVDNDGYPDVVYNAMFDIPDTTPPRYRGEIWLGLNPGPDGWDEPWETVVIDDDNWASADMWFNDFDGDGNLDLIANQIFSSTVTRYWHPGEDPTAEWRPEVIISGLTSPSDMWLADMDGDGLVDVVSADHTAHTGVWHRNPGPGADEAWEASTIYRDIGMPGDFAMSDVDDDGDLDWVGVSMTNGQAFIVEQVEPASSLVATIRRPEDVAAPVTRLVITLARELPVTGMPVAILAVIDNVDNDGDGELDVDQILAPGDDLVIGFDDVAVVGDFHVVAALYVAGGGEFQPVDGIDHLAASELLTFGDGPTRADLDLQLYRE